MKTGGRESACIDSTIDSTDSSSRVLMGARSTMTEIDRLRASQKKQEGLCGRAKRCGGYPALPLTAFYHALGGFFLAVRGGKGIRLMEQRRRDLRDLCTGADERVCRRMLQWHP